MAIFLAKFGSKFFGIIDKALTTAKDLRFAKSGCTVRYIISLKCYVGRLVALFLWSAVRLLFDFKTKCGAEAEENNFRYFCWKFHLAWTTILSREKCFYSFRRYLNQFRCAVPIALTHTQVCRHSLILLQFTILIGLYTTIELFRLPCL